MRSASSAVSCSWPSASKTAAAAGSQVSVSRTSSAHPAPPAIDHKLGGPPHERRYTAPSYELSSDGRAFSIPGYNPVEAYEAALANFGLTRRARPESVAKLLAWASEPLATAEVIAIMQADPAKVRAELAGVATPIPAGADFYWAAR